MTVYGNYKIMRNDCFCDFAEDPGMNNCLFYILGSVIFFGSLMGRRPGNYKSAVVLQGASHLEKPDLLRRGKERKPCRKLGDPRQGSRED